MRRLLPDLRQLRRDFAEAFSRPPKIDEETRLEITVSARAFSRRAREMVDDKLTFTAALMRAGEVEAANRLLSEVERDVREEEATLFERVNEARAAASIRRQAMTRFRLMRVLATAMVGASLLAFSGIGMAVISWLDERGESEVSYATGIEAARFASGPHSLTPVKVAGVAFELDRSQLKRFERLTNGGGDPTELQAFLLGVLPPELAERVHRALTSVSQAAAPAAPVAADVAAEVTEAERAARKKAKDAQSSQPKPGSSSGSGNGEGSGSDGGNENKSSGGNGGNGDDEEEEDRDESGGPLPGLP
jgi:uncharacterized membrane protein YgcG